MIYLTKSIAALFGLILLGFAALQFNDPDPIIWVTFYCICAAVPLLLLANKFIHSIFWLTLAICGLELFLTASGAYNYYLHMDQEPLMQSMNPNKPYIEEAREFLGALIALLLVCISALLARYGLNNKK
jgi:heme O synthase-like polyprenyltransferase